MRILLALSFIVAITHAHAALSVVQLGIKYSSSQCAVDCSIQAGGEMNQCPAVDPQDLGKGCFCECIVVTN